MKEKCDTHCETCPMQTQVHCSVVHARAAYITANTIAERLTAIEQALKHEAQPLFNPLNEDTDSATPPALELGGNL